MKTIWTAIRSILAVVAGIVVMSLLAFAIEIPLRSLTVRVFSFPNEEALNVNIWWKMSQVLYTVPALMLGGYLAARLAPKKGFQHAVAMAVVQELLIIALIFNPPHPNPAWMWALTLLLTPVAIIYGGRIYQKRQRQ